MDKEFLKLWISKLRSGEYKQGKSFLYDDTTDTYCCLGVAGTCKNVPKDELNKVGLYSLETIKKYSLPSELKKTELGCVLATMNDSEDKTFAQIADFLEQKFL